MSHLHMRGQLFSGGGDGVAKLSPFWGRYRNGHLVAWHEVLVQTLLDDLTSI